MEKREFNPLIGKLSVIFEESDLSLRSWRVIEERQKEWAEYSKEKLSEAHALLEKIPDRDIVEVLDRYMDSEYSDFIPQTVKQFLYRYLRGRYNKLADLLDVRIE